MSPGRAQRFTVILALALLAPLRVLALPSLLGDLSDDTQLTAEDAVRLVGHQTGRLELSPSLRPWADLDGNSTSDPADLGLLRDVILGRRASTPYTLSPTTLVTSPLDGEEGVAVTRETIIRLSYPLAPAEIVGSGDVFVSFDDAPLVSTIVVSPDRTVVTLFHPGLLPGAARVRLTILGDNLLDAAGSAIDADGDGTPGGTAIVDFDTLGLTALPGTIACGRVFASELGAGPDGASVNVPLEGVTITVDGAPGLLAVTNEMGSFRMDPAPAGRFFVHVDGRAAVVGGSLPEGAYYPFVGKPWETVPGQETNVGDVFLPLVLPGTLQPVSPTSDTRITFVDAYTDEHPELEGVEVNVPAGSLYADDGTVGGKVGIAPVPPDRLPGTLPEGLDFDLVITVQTDGATNFATPVPACFPTPTDPTTDELLQPGDKSTLWSFNHDAGRWEAIGAMTVTPDGRLACSDPGVGIQQPGWHGTLPGYTASGGETVFPVGGEGGIGEDGTVAEVPGYPAASMECPPAALSCSACFPEADEPGEGVPSGVTDPVSYFSGELVMRQEDLRIPGVGIDFRWVRTYRSKVRIATTQGNGWEHGYDIFLEEAGPDLRLHDGGTRQDIYRHQPDGTWTRGEVFRELVRSPDGSFVLTFPDRSRWELRALDGGPAQGRLARIVDRNGNALAFGYDGDGRLSTITDTLGRDISVAYDARGLVTSVTDFEGRSVRYAYYADGDAGGSLGDLESVSSPAVTGTPNGNDFPAGRTTTYTYSKGFTDERLNHNLLTLTDGRRNDPSDPAFGSGPRVVNVYAATQDPTDPLFDRIVRQVWGGGTVDLTYAAQVPAAANGHAVTKTIVNDRVGNVKELFYDAGNRLVQARDYTGRAIPDQPTTDTLNRPAGKLRATDPDWFTTTWEYNADSLVTRVVFPNGNELRNDYEADLNPAAPPLTRGNLRRVTRLPGTHVPAGAQAQLVSEYEYDARFSDCCGFDFVTREVDARGVETTHEYDARGNRIRTVHGIPSIVEEWEYDARGRVTAHVWPEDANGRRRRDELTYHGSGPGAGYLEHLVADAGGLALTTTTERDARGNILRRVDPRGSDTIYAWNQLDELVVEQSPELVDGTGLRRATTVYRDANGNMTRLDVDNRDESGALRPNPQLSTLFDYDVLDRLTRRRVEAEEGRFVTEELAYDLNGNQVLARSGEAVAGRRPASAVRTVYDERGLPFKIVRAPDDPLQSTTQSDYDGNGNLVRVVEGVEDAPRAWSFTWDGFDRMIRRDDPMGNALHRDLDAAGRVAAWRVEGELADVPGSAGNVRLAAGTLTHDAMGRLARTDQAFFDPATGAPYGDGVSSMVTAYDGMGNVVSLTDDNGHAATFEYDAMGRTRRVVDAAGNVVEHVLDADGNPLTTTETDVSDLGGPPQIVVTQRAYDALGRLVHVEDAIGGVEDVAYDSLDNVVRLRDAMRATPSSPGNVVRHAFDGLGRLVSTSRALTSDGTGSGAAVGLIATTYEWDDNSQLVATTDGLGNATRWTRDALGRAVELVNADGSTRTARWNVHGEAIERIDENGTRVTLLRDLAGRVTRMDVAPASGVSADTTFVEMAHDGLGRLVSAEDDDSLVTRAYDSLGGMRREDADGLVLARELDGLGNVNRMTLPSGRIVTTNRDALDRPRTVSDGTGVIATYDWLGRGRVTRRTLGNGVVQSLQWDALRRPTRTTHVAPGSVVLVDEQLEWDAMSRVAAIEDLRPGGLRRELDYDSVGRLVTSAIGPAGGPAAATSYAYDAAGNRTLVTGGPDPGSYVLSGAVPQPRDLPVNQYTTTPFDTRQYDERGSLVRIDAGLPTEKRMTFDFAGRLVRAEGPDGTTTHAYDALGRRVRTTVAGAQASSLVHAWNGWDLAEDLDAGTSAVQRTYTKGPLPDEMVHSRAGGSDSYLLADALRHVQAVADGSAGVLERYEYEDFGEPAFLDPGGAPRTASAVGNRFLFSGRWLEPSTGLYHARTRDLDARAGRFIQRDAIGTWGDPRSLGNAFTYVANDPWSMQDPMGTCGESDPAWASLIKKAQEECDKPPAPDKALTRTRNVVATWQEYLAYLRQIETTNPVNDWRAVVAAIHSGGKQGVDVGGTLPMTPIPLFSKGPESVRGREIKLPNGGVTMRTPGGKRVNCSWDVMQVTDPTGRLVDITHAIAGMRADINRTSGITGLGIWRGFMLRANTSWGDAWQMVSEGNILRGRIAWQPNDQWLGDDMGIAMAQWYRDGSNQSTSLSSALQQYWEAEQQRNATAPVPTIQPSHPLPPPPPVSP